MTRFFSASEHTTKWCPCEQHKVPTAGSAVQHFASLDACVMQWLWIALSSCSTPISVEKLLPMISQPVLWASQNWRGKSMHKHCVRSVSQETSVCNVFGLHKWKQQNLCFHWPWGFSWSISFHTAARNKKILRVTVPVTLALPGGKKWLCHLTDALPSSLMQPHCHRKYFIFHSKLF